MRHRAFSNVVLLGLLTFSLAPGLAGAGPVISVSPATHDFGRVNVGSSSGTFGFTVTNTGDAILTIFTLNHSNAAVGFSALAASLSIPPFGGTTTISTRYTPNGSGPYSDNVTIVSDATNGSVSFLLTGIANNPPVFTPPLAASYSASASVAFSLTASATDPEGDPINYTLQAIPPIPLATFNTSTGTFTWTPGCGDAGTYDLTFCASDGVAQTCQTVTLTVSSTPPCPALISRCPSAPPINLNNSLPECFYIEPIGVCFSAADVVTSTVVIKFDAATPISPSGAASVVDQCPANSINEVKGCFSKANLNALFSSLGPGITKVNLTLAGNLVNGCTFQGSLQVRVIK